MANETNDTGEAVEFMASEFGREIQSIRGLLTLAAKRARRAANTMPVPAVADLLDGWADDISKVSAGAADMESRIASALNGKRQQSKRAEIQEHIDREHAAAVIAARQESEG